MFDYGGTKMPNTHNNVALPFEVYRSATAVVFDSSPIIRLEKPLPTDVQSSREVADVHQAFPLKLLTNARLQRLINFPAIDDRRFTTFLRGFHTIEPNQ